MNEREFAEVLQFIQQQMREYGLASLNDRIVSDLRIDPGDPSLQVLRYLDALESELRLGTDATVRSITERFRTTVETESGRPVEGLSLLVTESDRDLFGQDVVDLGVGLNLEGLIGELVQLQADLREIQESGR